MFSWQTICLPLSFRIYKKATSLVLISSSPAKSWKNGYLKTSEIIKKKNVLLFLYERPYFLLPLTFHEIKISKWNENVQSYRILQNLDTEHINKKGKDIFRLLIIIKLIIQIYTMINTCTYLHVLNWQGNSSSCQHGIAPPRHKQTNKNNHQFK